jgi:hypothetical protein
MKTVVLRIKENKFSFFMELLKSFDFVSIQEGDSKEEIVKNLTSGFKDLKAYKNGHLKTSSGKSFLNEL